MTTYYRRDGHSRPTTPPVGNRSSLTLEEYLKKGLGNTPVTRTTSVTYLGMKINDKLTWWPHIQDKIKKAKHLLRRSNDTFGRLWGPKPTMVKWLLDAVVAPKLLYGSHVWHSMIGTRKVQDALHQINRLGIISVAPSRLRTPTRGMEIILGTTPLHLKAERKNILTLTRFRMHHPDTPVVGHTRAIMDTMAMTGLAGFPLDDIPVTTTPTLFRTYIGSPPPEDPGVRWVKIDTKVAVTVTDSIVSIYTDGSKMENTRGNQWGTGAGFAIFLGQDDVPIVDNPPVVQSHFNICHSYTVFLAEVLAIDRALRSYHEARKAGTIPFPRAILIHSDSQAAILALNNSDIHSKVVLACKRLLNVTATLTPLHLSWVKAHASSHRNNWVDGLAKAGATQDTDMGPFPRADIPLSFLKKVIRDRQQDRWGEEWTAHPTCRQTKLWLPAPNPGLSRAVLLLDRVELGRIIRWLTGHNFLRRHCQIVDPDRYQSDRCRLCRLEPETAAHILADCMALDYNRLADMKETHLVPPYRWSLGRLLRFLDPLADQMEDTEAAARMITVRARFGTRTTLLERIAVINDTLQLDPP